MKDTIFVTSYVDDKKVDVQIAVDENSLNVLIIDMVLGMLCQLPTYDAAPWVFDVYFVECEAEFTIKADAGATKVRWRFRESSGTEDFGVALWDDVADTKLEPWIFRTLKGE